MLHGKPAWSFIWRKVIPPLVGAGYRCIAPDHAGCGRSDKPMIWPAYWLERHVALGPDSLLDELDLHDVTLVLHNSVGRSGSRSRSPARSNHSAVVLDTALKPP